MRAPCSGVTCGVVPHPTALTDDATAIWNYLIWGICIIAVFGLLAVAVLTWQNHQQGRPNDSVARLGACLGAVVLCGFTVSVIIPAADSGEINWDWLPAALTTGAWTLAAVLAGYVGVSHVRASRSRPVKTNKSVAQLEAIANGMDTPENKSWAELFVTPYWLTGKEPALPEAVAPGGESADWVIVRDMTGAVVRIEKA